MSRLPPEIEEGNVEYKLKLVDPSPSRFEHLVTQMKWRLQEGNGEAIYELGVEDNGMLIGLSDNELTASWKTISAMANRLGATISILRERVIGDKKVLELLIRKIPEDQQFIDMRVAVLGNVDSGKSTLLGVLTQGELDNGRGQARLNLFRHLHEMQSGRTSSVCYEILGFNSEGKVVNYLEPHCAENICEKSSKLLTFIDLAGHAKYLKTTIFGLTSNLPDFCMLLVTANNGVVPMTQEHLGFAYFLNLPTFFIISKTDLCSEEMTEKATSDLETLLKSTGCNKIPLRIRTENDAIMAATQLHFDRVAPILSVSSVTGTGLNLLREFLYVLPPLRGVTEMQKLSQLPVFFQIYDIFSVPNVGLVVSGLLLRGSIKERTQLLLGPMSSCDSNSNAADNSHKTIVTNNDIVPSESSSNSSSQGEQSFYEKVTVESLHRYRQPSRLVLAGQTASISFTITPSRVIPRKGMVLLDVNSQPISSMEFDADIFLLCHSGNSISNGFQCVIHCGSIRQTASVVNILDDKEVIGVNQTGRVRFRFSRSPECLQLGSRLVFREGITKGLGQITQCIQIKTLVIDVNNDKNPGKLHKL